MRRSSKNGVCRSSDSGAVQSPNKNRLQIFLCLLCVLCVFVVNSAPVPPLVIIPPQIVQIGEDAIVQPVGDNITVRGFEVWAGSNSCKINFTILKCCAAEKFQWLAASNRVYQVESSTNLLTWQSTGARIIGRGILESWYEPITNHHLFHRLILTP